MWPDFLDRLIAIDETSIKSYDPRDCKELITMALTLTVAIRFFNWIFCNFQLMAAASSYMSNPQKSEDR
jgi:hypothetical protein